LSTGLQIVGVGAVSRTYARTHARTHSVA